MRDEICQSELAIDTKRIAEVDAAEHKPPLSHHGMLIAARAVEGACVLALQFERTARMQLLAMAAGKIQPIPPELGHEAHDWILTPKRSQVGFSNYARRALRTHADVLS